VRKRNNNWNLWIQWLLRHYRFHWWSYSRSNIWPTSWVLLCSW